MAAPVTDSEVQREERLAEVARLYLDGMTQVAIGRQIGVHQTQISYDLKIVRARWLESSVRDFDEAKAQELAKIDNIEAKFMAAWERSTHVKQVTSTKRKEGKDASTEASVTKQEQPGDPRFLDGAMKCIAKRCEIMGFDAPKKTAFVNPDGTSYGPFLTDDERRSRLLALITGQDEESTTRPTTIQ